MAKLGLSIGIDADVTGLRKMGQQATAQLELIPMMVVCGPRDEAAGTVSLRDRVDGDLGAMTLEAAVERLRDENARRAVRHRPKPLAIGGSQSQAADY